MSQSDDMIKQRISRFRKEIDAADEEIVRLLNKRALAAMKIGQIKKEVNWPIYVPTREEQVIAHVKTVNQGPLSDEAIGRLFERIIDESRRQERESNS